MVLKRNSNRNFPLFIPVSFRGKIPPGTIRGSFSLVMALFLGGCVLLPRTKIEVQQGVLDLRSWKNYRETIPLTGQWLFFHHHFLQPEEDRSPDGFIHAPGPWNDQKPGDEKIPAATYGTYRMSILVDPSSPVPLGIHMPQMGTSSRLYINGKLEATAGKPGPNRKLSEAGIRRRILPVNPDPSGKIDLILHVANYDHRNGGFRDAIRFGSFNSVERLREYRLFVEFVLFGAFLIMGAYHLGLFLLRPSNRSALWFSIFTLALGSRGLFLGEAFIYDLFPDIPYLIGLRLEYLFAYTGLPAFSYFFHSLYPEEFPSRHMRVVLIVSILASLTLLSGDGIFFSRVIQYVEVFVVFLGIYAAVQLTKATLRGRTGARILLGGWALIFASFLYDMLIFNFLYDGVPLMMLGVLGFIFSQAYVLSMHFTRAFQEVEILSNNLERKVLERTEEYLKAKQAMETAYESRSVFLANISHEVRTPLNAILGLTDLMEEDTQNQEQKKYIRIFRNASKALLNVVNDVLELSRIQTGRIELKKEAFQLPTLLEDIQYLYLEAANQANLTFRLEQDPSIPETLEGDAQRITQSISNLVSNAIKFTEKGSITLRSIFQGIESERAKVRIDVEDTGIGISPEDRQVIFQRFTQAESGPGRKHGGAGLGLATARELVDLMGGTLTVESEPGEGSRFSIFLTLPLPERTEIQDADSRTIIQESSAENSLFPEDQRILRILIVDDTEDNLFIMERYLSRTSHIVETAKDGSEAVEKIRFCLNSKSPSGNDGPPACYDLIFMDIQMPGMDGYTAASAIRKLENESGAHPHPMIALTAHVLDEDIEKALQAGFNEHMKKPIKKTSLLEKVREYEKRSPGKSDESTPPHQDRPSLR